MAKYGQVKYGQALYGIGRAAVYAVRKAIALTRNVKAIIKNNT